MKFGEFSPRDSEGASLVWPINRLICAGKNCIIVG